MPKIGGVFIIEEGQIEKKIILARLIKMIV